MLLPAVSAETAGRTFDMPSAAGPAFRAPSGLHCRQLGCPLAPPPQRAYNRSQEITPGEPVMEYRTVREAAKKWDLLIRMMQPLCARGRILGAERFRRSWAVPDTAEKPTAPRKGKKGGGACDR